MTEVHGAPEHRAAEAAPAGAVGQAAHGGADRAQRLGTGPVGWLLLPGVLGSGHEWTLLGSPGLGCSALAPDLGAGSTLRGLARLLLPLLPPQPVVVVGCSLGGLVGAALAQEVPERVAALICIGSLASPAAVAGRVRAAGRLSRVVPPRLWSWAYRARLGRELAAAGVPEELRARLLAAAPDRELWRARLEAIHAWGLPASLPVPGAALVGARSPYRPAAPFGLQPQRVPGGHRPHLEAPVPLREVLCHTARALAGAGWPGGASA